MAASKHNLTVESGATHRTKITWKGSDGLPINLTSASARMQVRKKADDTEFLLELTTANGGIILGGATGEITIYMTDLQTSNLSSGVYDLEVIFPLADVDARPDVIRLLYGSVTVVKNVTR